MVDDDVLFRFRLRLFSLAAELGNVRAACRIFGVHPSTYYRWRGPVLRSGLEMLRPRERRPPRMPNQTSQLTEQRILAFASATRVSDRAGSAPRLAQERWGGIVVSPNGVWRVLRRHGLSPADQPASPGGRLCRASRSPSDPRRSRSATSRSTTRASSSASTASTSAGLAGTSGRVWQYTAIDLATRVRLGGAATDAAQPVGEARRRPSRGAWRPTSRAHGWRLERVLTDNGSEFRSGLR